MKELRLHWRLFQAKDPRFSLSLPTEETQLQRSKWKSSNSLILEIVFLNFLVLLFEPEYFHTLVLHPISVTTVLIHYFDIFIQVSIGI